jgi:hypothetical protein
MDWSTCLVLSCCLLLSCTWSLYGTYILACPSAPALAEVGWRLAAIIEYISHSHSDLDSPLAKKLSDLVAMARYVPVEAQEPEHLKWMRLAMEMVWYGIASSLDLGVDAS